MINFVLRERHTFFDNEVKMDYFYFYDLMAAHKFIEIKQDLDD
jgi:hypothetical protein